MRARNNWSGKKRILSTNTIRLNIWLKNFFISRRTSFLFSSWNTLWFQFEKKEGLNRIISHCICLQIFFQQKKRSKFLNPWTTKSTNSPMLTWLGLCTEIFKRSLSVARSESNKISNLLPSPGIATQFTQKRSSIMTFDILSIRPATVATLATFLGLLLTVIAFSTPYWLATDGYAPSEKFHNLGLWEVCLTGFRDPNYQYDRELTGCKWLFDEDYNFLLDILEPRKFYSNYYVSVLV